MPRIHMKYGEEYIFWHLYYMIFFLAIQPQNKISLSKCKQQPKIPPTSYSCLTDLLNCWQHMLHKLRRMSCRRLFKGRIIHLGTVVRLIRNRPDHHKGHMVQICGMCNGRAFHFNAESLEVIDNGLFHLLIADKLVTADNPSCVYGNFRVHLLTA